MISVAAFDISLSSTGWAAGVPAIMDRKSAHPGYGTFEPDKGEDTEHLTLYRFWELLQRLHTQHNLTHIVWERIFVSFQDPRGRSKFQFNGTRRQFQMEGVLLAFCGMHNIQPLDVGISTWREHAYGSAKAPPNEGGKLEPDYWKKVAVAWAAKAGYFVTTHDEAEALAIMDWALSMLDSRYAGWSDPIFRRNGLDQIYRRGIHGE